MKKLMVLILLFSSFLFAMSDKELAITINLSGKQRMLTQKMSKEALEVYLGIDLENAKKNLKKSSALFDRTLKGLINGDKELGLVPTTNKEIQAQLQKIKEIWEPFYAKIKDIYNMKNLDDKTFNYIYKNNPILLKEMNKAVFMYAKLGNEGSNKLKMANDINLAGRQRMLTQKIAKDLLFIKANIKAKEALKDLKESITLFDKTLNGLFHGDKEMNLVGTKLPKIVKQLKITQEHWLKAKKLVEKALKSNNNEDIQKAIKALDSTKDEMNKAVVLYTKSLNRQKQILKISSIINSFLHKKESGKHVVNLAGRQRMLTQRISKLSIECAANLIPKSCDMMEKYAMLYEKTLVGFEKGDNELELQPSKNPKALAQIDTIKKLWEPFAKATLKMQKSKGKDLEALKFILLNNIKLLKESDKLVKIFRAIYQKNLTYLEAAKITLVDIAGRQRMLTQKMTKEFLETKILHSKTAQNEMQKSIKLFDDSLKMLIKGSKKYKLPKVTNPKIKAQLLKVTQLWEKIMPFYYKNQLNKKEMVLLLKANPILLNEMNKAVFLIEKSTDY